MRIETTSNVSPTRANCSNGIAFKAITNFNDEKWTVEVTFLFHHKTKRESETHSADIWSSDGRNYASGVEVSRLFARDILACDQVRARWLKNLIERDWFVSAGGTS